MTHGSVGFTLLLGIAFVGFSMLVGYVLVRLERSTLNAQGLDAEAKARIAKRDQLLEHAIAVTNAGKFNDAIRLLEQVYTLEESIVGPAHEELLGTLLALAEVAAHANDSETMVGIYKRQHRITEKVYGKKDYRTQEAERALFDAEKEASCSSEDPIRPERPAELRDEAAALYGKGKYSLYSEGKYAVYGEAKHAAAVSLSFAERDELWRRASASANAGKYDDATRLLEQVYTLEESILGLPHEELLRTLQALAEVAAVTNDSHAIISLFTRRYRIIEKVYGEKDYRTQEAHRDISDAQKAATRSPKDRTRLQRAEELGAEAAAFYGEGKYAAAISRSKEATEICKAVLGEQHPDYLASLNTLAVTYFAMGDYASSEPLTAKVMDSTKAVLGEQHPNYATSLINLASFYKFKGDYVRAEPLYVEAMEIQGAVLGEQHPNYADSVHHLAQLYFSMGDYARAEPLQIQGMEIRKAVLGEQHPDYATSLNDLALMYFSMGDYARAEPLQIQGTEMRKSMLGVQHPQYAASLNNLAALYTGMADYGHAEPLLIQAMEIQKSVLGEQHLDYATSLNNLGGLYNSMRDYARAEPLYIEAMKIGKVALGEEHPHYAASVNNLAMLYYEMGDYARAEPLHVQAIVIRKAILGAQHADYAQSLNNLANVYFAMADYPRAKGLYLHASEIYKAMLGDQHPHYAVSLSNLAIVHKRMGDPAGGAPFYTQAIEITIRHLDQTASVQTESQQISMSQSLKYRLESFIDCGLAMDPQPPAIMRQVMTWKGSVFVRLRGLRLAASDPAIADTFETLRSNAQKLSALINAIPTPEKQEAWKVQIAELARQKDKLDTQLMRDSVALRSAQQKVSLDDVRQAIPDDGVIVNYSEYGDLENGRGLLMATVVRRDAEPVMVSLGSVADAAEAIRGWRETLGADDAARQAGVRLRKQIWEPLLPHLGVASLIFVSTDGMLGQLPFAALPGKAENSYLIEDHAIVMLPVPMLLPRMMQRPTSEPGLQTAVLMGDVDYDSAAPINPAPESKASTQPLLAGTSLRGVREGETYAALSATGPEIDAIAKLFRDSDAVVDPEIISLRGRGATESAFREVAEKTRWMHLATHGFFAAADKKNAMAAVESDRDKSGFGMLGQLGEKPKPLVGFSPGRLSGLVFAGANQWSPSKDAATTSLAAANAESLDDGIMTADEIMYMQLENVDLAVLSACETGLGATAGGEGILGLQRAFQVAGARTTVTSLWKVDDAATQALMVEFYRNLLERKLSRLESLRQAQLWLLNHPEAIAGRNLTRGKVRELKPLDPAASKPPTPNRSLPAYWAAFQLSGDPR